MGSIVMKTHLNAMHVFLRVRASFCPTLNEGSKIGRGVNKALMFVRSIDCKERMAIEVQLENDDGANGLTEDWARNWKEYVDDTKKGRREPYRQWWSPLPMVELGRDRLTHCHLRK